MKNYWLEKITEKKLTRLLNDAFFVYSIKTESGNTITISAPDSAFVTLSEYVPEGCIQISSTDVDAAEATCCYVSQ
jgi:hypothetical protein